MPNSRSKQSQNHNYYWRPVIIIITNSQGMSIKLLPYTINSMCSKQLNAHILHFVFCMAFVIIIIASLQYQQCSQIRLQYETKNEAAIIMTITLQWTSNVKLMAALFSVEQSYLRRYPIVACWKKQSVLIQCCQLTGMVNLTSMIAINFNHYITEMLNIT